MKRPVTLTTIALALTLAASGCGSSSGSHTTTSDAKPATTAAISQPATPATLEQGVRRAVNEDHALVTQALLTNRVPAHPEAAAGPALTYLRRSAAQRRAQNVRVQIVSEAFHLLAVQLDPSYTTATATVLNTQRVQPTYRGRAGRPSTSHEHVRIELRRVGNSERFVVWKVTLLR
jgi:hypothetical protein